MDVTAAVLVNNGRVLIAKRAEGKWEFPGGKVEENETMEECIRRELQEELGADVKNLRKFMKVREKAIVLHVFIGAYEGEIKVKEHMEAKWVEVKDLENYDFMEADKEIVEQLMNQPTFRNLY